MVKSMIIKNSPLRILDATLKGGVGSGNLGLLASGPGVGKTAALVHIATDKLLQGKHVLHVTYGKKPEHTISYYEEIFQELSKTRNLEGAMDVHDEIVKSRSVMNLETMDVDHLLGGLEIRLSQGGFIADAVIIEDLDFSKAGAECALKLKKMAKEKNVEVWISASPKDGTEGVPAEAKSQLDSIDVVLTLKVHGKHIHLELEKAHGQAIQDPHLLLDPKTLLIVKE